MAAPAEAGSSRFRPSFKACLAAGTVFLMLLGLASWQVQRLFWKTDLIEMRQTRSQMAPLPLPPVLEDPAAFEFRLVTVTGRFLHGDEMYLGARSLNNNLGYHVITPLLGAEGTLVLVDRGWVPLDRKLPDSRAEGQLEGVVSLEGILRLGGRQGWFTPDNRADENFWYWVDLAAMEVALGRDLMPLMVEAGPAPNPGGYPIGGQTRIDLPNDHLQYAVTWYALAVALVVIFVLYHRGGARREDGQG